MQITYFKFINFNMYLRRVWSATKGRGALVNMVRSGGVAGLVAGLALLLSACHTASDTRAPNGQPIDTEFYSLVPSPPPVPIAPASAAPTQPAWMVGFGDLSANLGKAPSLVWTACIEKQGAEWKLESINGICTTADGAHEILWLDFGNRIILDDATFDQLNVKNQTSQDRQAGIRITCHRRVTGTDNLTQAYKAVRNICVSHFSKTDVGGGDVITHTLLAPVVLAGGIEHYHVALDYPGLLAAAISSGAVDDGLARSREAAGVIIDKATASKDLLALRAAGGKFFVLETELADRLNRRLASLQGAEAAQAADLAAKAAAVRQVEEAKQLEAQRQQQLQARKAEEQEIARNRVLTQAFRKSLKVGTETHCGLVLSINGPVAVVQAPAPIGQYGLKIDQLYPAGLAPCQFYNGIYQDPRLPF